MKNKGQSNLIGLVFLCIIFIVAVYAGLSSLAVVHSANTAGCVFDENNSLRNCSQSDFAYAMENQTINTAVPMFQVSGYMIWVLVAGVLIGVLGVLYKVAT